MKTSARGSTNTKKRRGRATKFCEGDPTGTRPYGKNNVSPFVRSCFWGVPCVIAILLYVPSLGYKFIFDDRAQILFNPQVHSWAYLPRILTTHVWSQKVAETLAPLYRPVFSVWLLILYSVVGSTEWAWHAANLTLYVITTYLVFRLAEELLSDRIAAAVAALLFAVHPIHIEAVCWISACNELIIGVLATGSVLLFLRQLRLEAQNSWSHQNVISLSVWTAALFAKESVLLLVIIFPYAAWHCTSRKASFGQQTKAVTLRSYPYLVAVLLYLTVRIAALGRTAPHAAPHTWYQVAFTAPSLVAFYAEKLFFPNGLSGFYLVPAADPSGVKTLAIVALTGAALCLLGWLSLKHGTGVAAILLLGPLVPVIGAFRVFLDGDTVHDRYLFIPSIGLCLFVGVALKPLLERRGAAKLLALALILTVVMSFGWLTLEQEGYYRDEQAYFGRALEIDPTNVLVMDYLGDSYMRDLRMPEALALFERAHRVAPTDPNTTYCLARGLYKNKQYEAAEPLLEDVVRESELRPLRRFTGGLLLAQDELALQRPKRARSILIDLTTEDPNAANVHFMLGSMDEVEGRLAEAQSEYLLEYRISGNSLAYERAVRLMRSDPHFLLPGRDRYQPQVPEDGNTD